MINKKVRLSDRLVNVIKNAVISVCGNTDVYLFGSRTDLNKIGGDIDIALDFENMEQDFLKIKSKIKANLIRQGYDLKIDIVKYNNDDPLLRDEIKNSGVLI